MKIQAFAVISVNHAFWELFFRPFFFDYLVYGSADPILQDFEEKKEPTDIAREETRHKTINY